MDLKIHIKTLAILSLSFLSFPVLAQNYEDDALKFSESELIGTARIKDIGGAQVALGGDLGTFEINPAVIAFYRSSDLGLSFHLHNTSNQRSEEHTSELQSI